MELPSDWIGRDDNGKELRRRIIRLLRNLNDSKQAALMWYNHLSATFENGVKRMVHMYCCFYHDYEDGDRVIACLC